MLESWLIAWWVLLLAMGWWPCCCGDGGGDEADDCYECNEGTTPLTVALEVSGFVDNDCSNCNLLNATHILEQDSLFPCEYVSDDVLICGEGGVVGWFTADLSVSAYTWKIIYRESQGIEYEYEASVPGGDCSVEVTASFTYDGTELDSPCYLQDPPPDWTLTPQ